MARRKKDRRKRDIITIARHNLLADTINRIKLGQIEDRRLYHPLGQYRALREVNNARPTLVPPKPSKRRRARSTLHQLRFKSPLRLILCIRRKQRREVLHAKRKTARRGRQGPHRRNQHSEISCKV